MNGLDSILGLGRREVRRLNRWYEKHQRHLPFRGTRDPYAIWVSETMLQQTRVAAMLPRYESFMRKFPTVFALAEAPEQAVLAAWQGLGYYSRARNLHMAATRIVLQHDGVFPRNLTEALALPGVGPYTAAAVLSIAFGLEEAVVDGNVRRVIVRLAGRMAVDVQSAADELLGLRGRAPAGQHNQALMELGATICLPKNPLCLGCPLAMACSGRGLHGGDVDGHLPARRLVREPLDVDLEVYVPFQRGARFLVVRHEKSPLLSGLWFFPFRLRQRSTGSGGRALQFSTPGLDLFGEQAQAATPVLASHRFRHSITHHRLFGTAKLLPISGANSRLWQDVDPTLEWKTVPTDLLEEWVVSSIAMKLRPLIREVRPAKAKRTADAR